jgi:CRP-like cAMP-binding protein
MEELKSRLRDGFQLDAESIASFTNLFSIEKIRKYDYFARNGEYAKRIAFVKSGILRAYFSNQKGEEYNKTFFTKGSFMGAYSSLISGEKNSIDIDCLTDCELYVTEFYKITQLYDQYPKIERMARLLAEYLFIRKEKREIELVTLDARERYAIFRKEHPTLEQFIPQYHIASYLGITPTQLSRIRRKN